MSQAKTTAQRVTALRQRRQEAGLTRLEVYAHPDDHAAVKAFAAKLQANREKQKKPRLAPASGA